MPYATESDLRLRFQLNDTVQVPSALIAQAIDDAHREILRFLDPRYDSASPDGALVLAETLLAGAAVCRALASRDAFDQKQLAVGGQRIDDGHRFQSLMAVASSAVEEGWRHLEPYLLDRPPTVPGSVTDTAPILNED